MPASDSEVYDEQAHAAECKRRRSSLCLVVGLSSFTALQLFGWPLGQGCNESVPTAYTIGIMSWGLLSGCFLLGGIRLRDGFLFFRKKTCSLQCTSAT